MYEEKARYPVSSLWSYFPIIEVARFLSIEKKPVPRLQFGFVMINAASIICLVLTDAKSLEVETYDDSGFYLYVVVGVKVYQVVFVGGFSVFIYKKKENLQSGNSYILKMFKLITKLNISCDILI